VKNFLQLPERTTKPRTRGTTALLDNGIPLERFRDVVSSFGAYIDFIKLGWCTGVLDAQVEAKFALAREADIEPHFGGTLFEKAVLQGRVDAFHRFCEQAGCRYIEISNGTIDLTNAEKARYVRDFSDDFRVLSEVGYKDTERSLQLHPARWIEFIQQDLEAGAHRIVTESRESGRSGICRENGEVRFGLIEEILDSGIDDEKLVFEAPNKHLQVFFIRRLGPDVNLANVSFNDVIALETVRLGLRADTLLTFDGRNP
jgi:phosphosulfolactate synthase